MIFLLTLPQGKKPLSRRIYSSWHTTFTWETKGSGGDDGKLKNDSPPERAGASRLQTLLPLNTVGRGSTAFPDCQEKTNSESGFKYWQLINTSFKYTETFLNNMQAKEYGPNI